MRTKDYKTYKNLGVVELEKTLSAKHTSTNINLKFRLIENCLFKKPFSLRKDDFWVLKFWFFFFFFFFF
jgi:hypothetical protein